MSWTVSWTRVLWSMPGCAFPSWASTWSPLKPASSWPPSRPTSIRSERSGCELSLPPRPSWTATDASHRLRSARDATGLWETSTAWCSCMAISSTISACASSGCQGTLNSIGARPGV